MGDGITYLEFGLSDPHKCSPRLFFERMGHPGAANCACPKFLDGSCVPHEKWDAWKVAIIKFRSARAEAQQQAGRI